MDWWEGSFYPKRVKRSSCPTAMRMHWTLNANVGNINVDQSKPTVYIDDDLVGMIDTDVSSSKKRSGSDAHPNLEQWLFVNFL